MTICLSHGGPVAYRSEEPSHRLLVATVKGVATLERSGAGEPWSETARALQEYHAVAIAREPESGVILASSHDGDCSSAKTTGRVGTGAPTASPPTTSIA